MTRKRFVIQSFLHLIPELKGITMSIQSDLVSGYVNLRNEVGGDFEFICTDGTLYSQSLGTRANTPLAKRRGFSRKFTPENGIKGYYFIDYICNKFNKQGIEVADADIRIVVFAQQIKEMLAHGGSLQDL